MKAWATRTDTELEAARPDTEPVPVDVEKPSEVFLAAAGDQVMLQGTFTAGDGEILQTAIDAARRLGQQQPVAEHNPETAESVIDVERSDRVGKANAGESTRILDERTTAQQRADALLLIARFFLDHCRDIGDMNGERPHVTVTVNADELAAGAGHGTGAYSWDLIPIDTVLEWMCDCDYTRMITGAESSVLDVGRKTRVAVSATRKAVTARDRCCRFPGCTMPARYNDVHHKKHWTKGGTTDRDNLLSLCRFHHYLVHTKDGWTITGNANETLTFTSPDGRTFTSRPPPSLRPPPAPTQRSRR